MFSQPLMRKWKRLLKEKYGLENPTSKEVFEFANNLTNFFDLLNKLDYKDKIKNNEKRNDAKS